MRNMDLRYVKTGVFLLLMGGCLAGSIDLVKAEAKYTYDELGRLTEVHNDDGLKEIYEYDADGNITSVIFGGRNDVADGTGKSDTKNADTQKEDAQNKDIKNVNTQNTNIDRVNYGQDQSNAGIGNEKISNHNISGKPTGTLSFGEYVYEIISRKKRTVRLVSTKSKRSKQYSVPAKVKLKKMTYTVTEVAPNAFKNCKRVKTITLGKNIKKIGKNAFYGCKKLKTLKVKSSKLRSVGANALKGIHKKAKIIVPKKKVAKYQKLFKNKGQKKTVKVVKK